MTGADDPRFLLDTNIFDLLVEDAELLSYLEQNKIPLFVTSLQDRELMAIRDEAKKQKIFEFWIKYTTRIDPAGILDLIDVPHIETRVRKMLTDFRSAFAAAQKGLTFVTQDRKLVQALQGQSIQIVDYQTFRRLVLSRHLPS